MKLLLLEDDLALRENIVAMLQEAGHSVDLCGSGQVAVDMAQAHDYAVLVLDRMVEGIDGLTALRTLRDAGVRTPALFLTAMTGIDDRVEGLEAGADDYLAKPFAARELLARIEALARRAGVQADAPLLRAGGVTLDRIRRIAMGQGRRIDLQSQEFKLLEYLLLNKGQAVTRSMLLENVWSWHFDTRTNVIESHMSRLRAKLAEVGEPDLIQTLRGVGYMVRHG
jgi:two-component system, OmpR family, response regulator